MFEVAKQQDESVSESSYLLAELREINARLNQIEKKLESTGSWNRKPRKEPKTDRKHYGKDIINIVSDGRVWSTGAILTELKRRRNDLHYVTRKHLSAVLFNLKSGNHIKNPEMNAYTI